MLAALRYRRAQALVLLVLSALVTTCLVLAPLYTRALEQATTATLLGEATVQESGLRLASSNSNDASLAMSVEELQDLVPRDVRGLFGTAVTAGSVEVRRMPLNAQPGGLLLFRDGMCDHVRFTAGRCPTAPGEIAVSTDHARIYEQPVGATVLVGEFDGAVSQPDATPRTTLRVVGVYDVVEGPYWFGDTLTGQASRRLGYDTMLTPLRTLTDRVTGPDGSPLEWFDVRRAVDLPLLVDRVDVDRIGSLASTVAELAEYPMGPENAVSAVAETVTVRSGLPPIADEVRVGREQASVTVPLLMTQLGLLLGCVLWLVLAAAADQRRGEVAVARLRGRGSRGARRLLLAETLPPILLGAPMGALLAVACSTVARQRVLTGDPPFEVPTAAIAALLAATALMIGLAVLSVRTVSREPVATLVRSVPARRGDVRLGVLESMLVAAAGAAFVALVTGSVDGPVGQIAPTLLGLAVGVAAARLMSFALAAGGRRLLRNGSPTTAVALLAAGRRGTTRWLVPVVTVALCIVVVTADALAIGARNWAGRAAAEVGAPTVLTLDSADLVAVTQALQAADPTGRRVTPVALVSQSSLGAATTVGVVPETFRRLALWPGVDTDSLPWDRLTAPTTPPLVLTGTRISYRVRAEAFDVVRPAGRLPPSELVLALRVVRADGTVDPLALGTLPATTLDAEQEVGVDCADGCRVTGIGVLAPRSAAAVTGSLMISGLAVDGRPVDLGGAQAWRDDTGGDVLVTGEVTGDGAEIFYSNNRVEQAFLTHVSVPDVVPALTTPAVTPSEVAATFGGSYVDGSDLSLVFAGDVSFVPGAPATAALVNLDNLLAQGWTGKGSAELRAYVDTRDPAFLSQVTAVLTERDIAVLSTSHPDELEAAYGRSAAAWSLLLAVAVAVLSVLVAAVGIIVLAATSWRARSRDYAGLRLVGLRPRGVTLLAQLETLPVIVCSAMLGVAVGLWASPPAVAQVPLFTTAPPTFPVDLQTAWIPALLAGAIGLGVLVLTGVVASHSVARRAELRRVRETG